MKYEEALRNWAQQFQKTPFKDDDEIYLDYSTGYCNCQGLREDDYNSYGCGAEKHTITVNLKSRISKDNPKYKYQSNGKDDILKDPKYKYTILYQTDGYGYEDILRGIVE